MAAQPLSKIELTFECANLPNLDTTTKSDPCIWLEEKPRGSSNWVRIGSTEVVRDNLNPCFIESIKMDYYFEEVQQLRARILDVDDPKKSFEYQDHIGDVEFTVGDVCGSRGRTLVRPIPNRFSKKAKLIVRAHELPELNVAVMFDVSGDKLDKKDTFGKSDPFLEILKPSSDGSSFVPVHRTEVIKKTLDPHWKPFAIDLSKLNAGDMILPLRFDVYDWDSATKQDFIGSFTASLQEIQNQKFWPLINPKKLKKKGYKDSGTIEFERIDLVKKPTFLDYLHGGTQINLAVAIDYTASNGTPSDPKSLHYFNPANPSQNQYQQVISSVGNILLPYDFDGMVPVFGFGGLLPNTSGVSHCFHVNGNPTNPEVPGVLGVLNAYQQSFAAGVRLSGPTYFGPVINNAAASLVQGQNGTDAYLILLIITDGAINDLDETIHEIVKASLLPMSIVIVGVGSANFGTMNFLDADGSLLKDKYGKKAEADIVQFVPFRDFPGQDTSRLAAAVLAEIPGQFLSYMQRHGFQPRPPPGQAQIQQLVQQQIDMTMTITPTTTVTH